MFWNQSDSLDLTKKMSLKLLLNIRKIVKKGSRRVFSNFEAKILCKYSFMWSHLHRTDSGHWVLHQTLKNKVIRDVFPTKLGGWKQGKLKILEKYGFFLIFRLKQLSTGKSEVYKTIYIRKLYPEEGLNMGKWNI